MGKFSRDKGARIERWLVRYFQEAGIAAERVPLSGAAGGKFAGDVSIPVLGDDWVCEVKGRATGFKQIRQWLGGNKALIVKPDRQEPLVVMTLRDARDVLVNAESYRSYYWNFANSRSEYDA